MLLIELLWGGSRDIAHLILDEELDSLNWSSSGFRDGSRHTTHYDKPSVNRTFLTSVTGAVFSYWLPSSSSCSDMVEFVYA